MIVQLLYFEQNRMLLFYIGCNVTVGKEKKYLENIFIAVYFALITVFKIYHLKPID